MSRSHHHKKIFNHGVGKYVRGVVPTMPPRKTMCSLSYRHHAHTTCSHTTFFVCVCACACVFVFLSKLTPFTECQFACQPAGQSALLPADPAAGYQAAGHQAANYMPPDTHHQPHGPQNTHLEFRELRLPCVMPAHKNETPHRIPRNW